MNYRFDSWIRAAFFTAMLSVISVGAYSSTPDKPDSSDLKKYSIDTLVKCFDDWHICGAADSEADGWQISDELARRGYVKSLLVRYWKEPKQNIRAGIEHVAYHFDTPKVTLFMRKILNKRVNDGEDDYWPVNYLAKKCDILALRELSTGRYRNQGSLQYQTSVELFGKCRYKQSIPYLIDDGLNDFSLNIVGAAQDSLYAFYPDAPRRFDSIEQMQRYFCGRARNDGFRVSCK